MGPSVLVAMSGGVDSSVAAAMLVEAGHDVVGVTMKMHDAPSLRGSKQGCCTVDDADDARSVAAALGIPYYVLDLSGHFAQTVMDPFVDAYAGGRTPNPCVECNRHVKFTELARRADALGVDLVATGHHARLEEGVLRRGADAAKDQSYVLACLPASVLERVRLPIGALTKTEVRERAGALGLRTAAKPESMEVCFLGDGGKDPFLRRRLDLRPGPVVDAGGVVVGEHGGAALYTRGQRRGLGVATGERLYVDAVDVARNVVRVSTRPPASEGFKGEDASWIGPVPEAGDVVAVQTSAHGAPRAATVRVAAGGAVDVRYFDTAPATAPGQLAAFYDGADGDRVLGAATVAAP